jgi:hypothetical protein
VFASVQNFFYRQFIYCVFSDKPSRSISRGCQVHPQDQRRTGKNILHIYKLVGFIEAINKDQTKKFCIFTYNLVGFTGAIKEEQAKNNFYICVYKLVGFIEAVKEEQAKTFNIFTNL